MQARAFPDNSLKTSDFFQNLNEGFPRQNPVQAILASDFCLVGSGPHVYACGGAPDITYVRHMVDKSTVPYPAVTGSKAPPHKASGLRPSIEIKDGVVSSYPRGCPPKESETGLVPGSLQHPVAWVPCKPVSAIPAPKHELCPHPITGRGDPFRGRARLPLHPTGYHTGQMKVLPPLFLEKEAFQHLRRYKYRLQSFIALRSQHRQSVHVPFGRMAC